MFDTDADKRTEAEAQQRRVDKAKREVFEVTRAFMRAAPGMTDEQLDTALAELKAVAAKHCPQGNGSTL